MTETLKVKSDDVIDFFANNDDFFMICSPMGITVKSGDKSLRLRYNEKELD